MLLGTSNVVSGYFLAVQASSDCEEYMSGCVWGGVWVGLCSSITAGHQSTTDTLPNTSHQGLSKVSFFVALFIQVWGESVGAAADQNVELVLAPCDLATLFAPLENEPQGLTRPDSCSLRSPGAD